MPPVDEGSAAGIPTAGEIPAAGVSAIVAGDLAQTFFGILLHFCTGRSAHVSLGTDSQVLFGKFMHFSRGLDSQVVLGTSVHFSLATVLHSCFGTLSHFSLGTSLHI